MAFVRALPRKWHSVFLVRRLALDRAQAVYPLVSILRSPQFSCICEFLCILCTNSHPDSPLTAGPDATSLFIDDGDTPHALLILIPFRLASLSTHISRFCIWGRGTTPRVPPPLFSRKVIASSDKLDAVRLHILRRVRYPPRLVPRDIRPRTRSNASNAELKRGRAPHTVFLPIQSRVGGISCAPPSARLHFPGPAQDQGANETYAAPAGASLVRWLPTVLLDPGAFPFYLLVSTFYALGAADRSLREGIIPVQHPSPLLLRPIFPREGRVASPFRFASPARRGIGQPTTPTPLHLEPRWIGGRPFPRRGRDARRDIVRASLQRILSLGARRSLTADTLPSETRCARRSPSLSFVGQQPPRLTSLSLPFLTSSAVADAATIPYPRATIARAVTS
ncbi:hypothetical protein DFH09DRAFT_1360112 [Mycena vulgaris]|nr:hypothetical protein DFH09DRAFT_1360112 [Mycena vulgaris]